MDQGNLKRVETGVIQFEDDWPGVFIRGDNAAYYAMELKKLLENENLLLDIITKSSLMGLLSDLQSCYAFSEKNKKKIQYIERKNG